jgi:hypothetical protein
LDLLGTFGFCADAPGAGLAVPGLDWPGLAPIFVGSIFPMPEVTALFPILLSREYRLFA